MFASFLIIIIVFIQESLEKEYSQYGKHNKEFDDNYYPYFSSPTRHVSEPINVKTKQPF
jgi:hypothetical protein